MLRHPIGATLLALAVLGSACTSPDLQRHEFVELVMASPARLVIYAEDERVARAAARSAYDRMHELDRTLSDWNRNSELSRLVAAAPEARTVSPLLRSATLEALRLSAATDGAFDPTIGPLVALWRRSRETGALPTDAERMRAEALVGIESIELIGDQMRIARPGTTLDFGGIGKGIALDEAGRTLDALGLPHHLIDLDGEIRAGQAPPEREAWRVSIADGEAEGIELALVETTASTSGDLHQFVEIDGVRYSHVVDPETGLGLTTPIQVTVIARKGSVSDALATAGCMLGPDGLQALLTNDFPEVSAVVTRRRGESLQVVRIGRIPVPAPDVP